MLACLVPTPQATSRPSWPCTWDFRRAVRSFTNPNRMPKVIALRDPHPGKNLGETMLRKDLRQLPLNEDEFLHVLEDC